LISGPVKITKAETPLFLTFGLIHPVKFDARQWVQYAKDAGMKYIVFVSKHHDGFVEWDSRLTDYKITNSPFGRDEYPGKLVPPWGKVGHGGQMINPTTFVLHFAH